MSYWKDQLVQFLESWISNLLEYLNGLETSTFTILKGSKDDIFAKRISMSEAVLLSCVRTFNCLTLYTREAQNEFVMLDIL